MSLIKNLVKLFLIVAFVVASLTSCRGTEKTEEDSSSASSGSGKDAETPGVPDPDLGFSVLVQYDERYKSFIHKGDGSVTDNWDAPCQILPGATGAAADIMCVIEIHELELSFYGLGIRFNVPPTMCNFVRRELPYYYRFQPGTGINVVTDNRAGTQTNDGVAPGGVSPYLKCPTDYSGGTLAAPNCCEGTYALRTWTDDTAAVPDKLVVTEGKWGGNASNCLHGPAMTVGKVSSLTGYPVNTTYNVTGTGINVGYFLEAQFDSLFSNLYAANYFNPADHAGGRPLATTATGFASTNLYHEFICLDRAEEELARIRVMVREWNTVDQLSLKQAGNPDVTGAEPSGDLINDNRDYLDFGAAYPGFAL